MLAFFLGNWLVSGALGIISWFIYKVYIWPYYLSPLRNLPGPPSESLFYGNFKRFFAEEAGEPHLRWIKQYGNIVRYHGLFNKPAIVVADTKALQEILLNQAYDFHKLKLLRGDFKHIIGQGVGLVENEVHVRHRKIMNPAFSHENIKNMVPKFSQVGFILKELIENKVNQGESRIRLTPYISKATLDIIGLVGFNHEFNALTSPSDLAKAYESMMNTIYTSILSLSISVMSVYLPFLRQIPISINKKYNYAREVIERESIKLINERYAQGEKNPLHGNDLLSLIIKVNKDFPDEEKFTYEVLRHQILGLLIGGHETSSTTIGWALYLLAEHPHEQDLLREELIKAFPDKSKFNPTYDEINSLEYLNCVVKETLRIHPMITFMSRFNVHDQVFGEYFIPKNTQIDIPIAALHRMPSIWGPTADDFDPKRWLDPALIERITNYNYMPFSTGPRGCIGYKLALGDIKVLLSILVRNFVFQPVKGLRIRKRVGFHGKPNPDIELIVSKFEDSPKKEE